MRLRILSTVLFAGALLAQRPPGPGPRPRMGLGQDAPAMAELKTYLGLTDGQLQHLQQERRATGDEIGPLARDIAQKQRALREQLDAGSTDASALGRLLVDVESLRKQIESKREATRVRAVSVLTPEQRTRLKTLEDVARLGDEVRQAIGAGLLDPPEDGSGGLGGPGPERFGRPGPFPRRGPAVNR